MATRKTTETADDIASATAAAGRRAGAQARRAGAKVGDTVERASRASASGVRRAARKSVDAYDETADELDGHVASLEETIRQSPLAAAGAALLIGVVLGRFIL